LAADRSFFQAVADGAVEEVEASEAEASVDLEEEALAEVEVPAVGNSSRKKRADSNESALL
jgi:hypothetical protein